MTFKAFHTGGHITRAKDIFSSPEHKVLKILKVGVTETRYVSLKFCRPWVIHAFKDTRGRGSHKDEDNDGAPLEEEGSVSKKIKLDDTATISDEQIATEATLLDSEQLTNTEPGNSEILELDEQNNDSRQFSEIPESSKGGLNTDMEVCATSMEQTSVDYEKSSQVPENSNKPSLVTLLVRQNETKITSEDTEKVHSEAETEPQTVLTQSTDSEMLQRPDHEGPFTSIQTRSSRKRKLPANEDVAYKSEEPPAVSSYDKVRLVCQPWRKPEGGINKPVFKMMLESVMLFLMLKPASDIKELYDRYSPYLQPMVLKNIVQVLEDIGCVTRQYIKPAKASLFSKPSQSSIADEDGEDCEVLLLPTLECMFKLGQFGQEMFPGVSWPTLDEFTGRKK